MLLLLSAYLGLSTSKIPSYGQSDKGLHFVTFFLLTVSGYLSCDSDRIGQAAKLWHENRSRQNANSNSRQHSIGSLKLQDAAPSILLSSP